MLGVSRNIAQSVYVFCGMAVITAVATAAAPIEFPVLRPGSPDIDASHVRERADSTRYPLRDAKGQPTGATAFQHAEEHLVEDAAGPAIMIVSSNLVYADTAIVLRRTLRPIREMQHYIARGQTLFFEYAGSRVRVRDSTVGSVKVREHTYDGDIFHFNELNLLIRSLPLRPGYNAIVPLFSEGDDVGGKGTALEMDTIQVVGLGDRGVWTIRFADPVMVSFSTLDGSTRRVISAKVELRDTVRMIKP